MGSFVNACEQMPTPNPARSNTYWLLTTWAYKYVVPVKRPKILDLWFPFFVENNYIFTTRFVLCPKHLPSEKLVRNLT